jgi:hydrogenase maturation protease
LRTLILGLGGRGYSKVQLGLQVARGLHALLKDPDVDIIEVPELGSTDLLALAAGYDKVVVVDCIESGQGDVGELRKLGLTDLELRHKRDSSGEHEYRATVQLRRSVGGSAPLEISVYAIEMGEGFESGDTDEALMEAVPKLVRQIAREEFGAGTREGVWL